MTPSTVVVVVVVLVAAVVSIRVHARLRFGSREDGDPEAGDPEDP